MVKLGIHSPALEKITRSESKQTSCFHLPFACFVRTLEAAFLVLTKTCSSSKTVPLERGLSNILYKVFLAIISKLV